MFALHLLNDCKLEFFHQNKNFIVLMFPISSITLTIFSVIISTLSCWCQCNQKTNSSSRNSNFVYVVKFQNQILTLVWYFFHYTVLLCIACYSYRCYFLIFCGPLQEGIKVFRSGSHNVPSLTTE